MIRKTGLTAILGIAALLVVGVGCRDGDAAAVEGGAESMSEPAALAAATAAQAPSSGSGIWVSGHARVTVEPDLVLLTVGVDVTADTVAEARAEAAGAMDAVVRAVKAHGLEDQDVQTRSFNIWPQYEYPEVTSGGTRTRRQVLVGYTVSNMAGIKIRDVDAVGAIIDDVAEAGGDKTRIDGVNFSVEDPEPFMAQLRQEAVRRRRRQGRPLREPHGRGRRRSGLHRRGGSRHAGGSELRVWGGSHGREPSLNQGLPRLCAPPLGPIPPGSQAPSIPTE